MTDTLNLLPCPFCGSKSSVRSEDWPDGGYERVSCESCRFSQMFKTKEQAVAAWNRRASPPAAVKVAGLGRITNEDNGYLTLQFKDEDAACQFARDHTPSVEVDEMPPLTADAVPEDALPPLPKPDRQSAVTGDRWHSAEAMQAYARAAVEADRAQRPENANQPLCDSALRAEPAGTGFLTIGWREALEKLRPDTTTHTHDTEIADAVLDEVIDALDDLEESQRCAAPHEQGNLGEMFIVAGGKWDGVRWVVENSDLATFMRSVLAAGAARQGGDGAPEAVSADRAQQGEPVAVEKINMAQAGVGERARGYCAGWNDCVDEFSRTATKAAAPDAPIDCLPWVEARRDSDARLRDEKVAVQRARMQAKFANRPRTAATADFDLPAPNDAAPVPNTGIPAAGEVSIDTPEFREVLDDFAYWASERRAMGGDFGSAEAEEKAEAALIAYIDNFRAPVSSTPTDKDQA